MEAIYLTQSSQCQSELPALESKMRGGRGNRTPQGADLASTAEFLTKLLPYKESKTNLHFPTAILFVCLL